MKTILIAEDHEDMRQLIERALQPLGCRVVSAASGKEAVALAESCRPDLVLLDVVMPDGHGFWVCKTLRERPEFAGLRILFLSSKAYGADRAQAMQLGADGYLTKPFSIEALQHAVSSLLDGGKQKEEA